MTYALVQTLCLLTVSENPLCSPSPLLFCPDISMRLCPASLILY
jgi:hypothetical protein